MAGKSIELFLVDGTPGGIITAEISGWTGKLISAPRAKLNQLLSRDEAGSNGVYLLLGEDPEAINSKWVYIGRTESFIARLRDHHINKPQWQRVVIVSSLHHSFNEGHWGYMEANLLHAAKAAARCTLADNKNTPRGRKLSESQEAAVEDFIKQVKMVLPILGVDIFRSAHSSPPKAEMQTVDTPIFTIERPKRGIKAHLKVVDGECFLLEGSHLALDVKLKGNVPSTRYKAANIRAMRQKLIDDGSFVIEETAIRVARDVPFSSPSAASNMVLAASTNGRKEWVTSQDQTYGDWEDSQK